MNLATQFSATSADEIRESGRAFPSLAATFMNIYPHCSLTLASVLVSLPVLSAHSFVSNWQLPFLNQRKEENGRRNVFMTKSTKTCFAGREDRTRDGHSRPSAYQEDAHPINEIPIVIATIAKPRDNRWLLISTVFTSKSILSSVSFGTFPTSSRGITLRAFCGRTVITDNCYVFWLHTAVFIFETVRPWIDSMTKMSAIAFSWIHVFVEFSLAHFVFLLSSHWLPSMCKTDHFSR